MMISEQQIQDALRDLIDPNTGKDFLSSKSLVNVRISGNDVELEIRLGYPAKSVSQEIRSLVTNKLKAGLPGLAGATAIKGFMGFGCKSHMHTTKVLRLSEDLPIVIEIVDSEEKINQFLPLLDDMVKEGLMTLEKVNVIMYRAGQAK